MHGKHAFRPRLLNLACVATSVSMNALAAGQGWRDLAIWIMPPVAYAVASDTLIGVLRAYAIARRKALNQALADDDSTPLAILGGLLLWLLRLTLAPASTVAGFRRWAVEECPVAPGRRAVRAPGRRALPPARPARHEPRAPARPPGQTARSYARPGTKTARFLALVEERHGPLASLPLHQVSKISAALAPEAGLHPGAARAVLRPLIQSLQNGDPS